MVLRGVLLRPPRRGVPTPDPDPMGSLRGLAPSCERRREPAKHHMHVVRGEHPSWREDGRSAPQGPAFA